MLTPETNLGQGVASVSRLLRIPSAAVQHMLISGYPIATHLIAGIYEGIQNLMRQTRQQEKMAALGKLSAGLAHELNNPAAVVRRAAELRRALSAGQDAALLLATTARPPDEAAALTAGLNDGARAMATRAAAAEKLDPLARSDREDDVAAWLDDHGVPDSYDAAGMLVDAGLDAAWLEGLAQRVPADALCAVVLLLLIAAYLLLGIVARSHPGPLTADRTAWGGTGRLATLPQGTRGWGRTASRREQCALRENTRAAQAAPSRGSGERGAARPASGARPLPLAIV